jgi:flavin-dependent dehydrogenase
MQSHRNPPQSADTDYYDVVIMGGALSGGPTATLLLRQNPGIPGEIDKTFAPRRRSNRRGQCIFHGAGAGLDTISQRIAPCETRLAVLVYKQGVNTLAEASELGPLYQARVPSYQLDRAAFDEEVLRRAGLAAAEILRPPTIIDVQLGPGKEQAVTFRNGGGTTTVRSRWIVDASVLAAIPARKEGWWKSNTEHPTAAA